MEMEGELLLCIEIDMVGSGGPKRGLQSGVKGESEQVAAHSDELKENIERKEAQKRLRYRRKKTSCCPNDELNIPGKSASKRADNVRLSVKLLSLLLCATMLCSTERDESDNVERRRVRE